MMPLTDAPDLITFPAVEMAGPPVQTLYRVTWDGCTIPWYVTAENPQRLRGKVRSMRADHRLPRGMRIAPFQGTSCVAPRLITVGRQAHIAA